MKIKDLLTDASKWTQKALARDKSGNRVVAREESAVQWCLMGAMHKCYPEANQRDLIRHKIYGGIRQDSIIDFNDAKSTSFENIQKLVKVLDI